MCAHLTGTVSTLVSFGSLGNSVLLNCEFVIFETEKCEREPKQPIDRCLAHLISMIIRSIETVTNGDDDGNITQSEVSEWMRRSLKGRGP